METPPSTTTNKRSKIHRAVCIRREPRAQAAQPEHVEGKVEGQACLLFDSTALAATLRPSCSVATAP